MFGPESAIAAAGGVASIAPGAYDGMYRLLCDLSPDAVVLSTWDEGICMEVNPGFTRMTGYAPEEVLGRSFLASEAGAWARPSDRARLQAMAEDGSGIASIETIFRRKDGSRYHGEVHAVKVDRDGVALMLLVVHDLSEARRAEARVRIADAQKGALSRELQHRVKNSLNVVSSLLNLGAAKDAASRPHDVLASARSRVGSMALVYDLIDDGADLESIDMSSYLRKLCASVASNYPSDEPRVGLELDLDNVRLGAETAVTVGLLVNELVSNSLRHAFPKGKSGHIAVRIKRTKEACALSVDDDGIGFASGSGPSGAMGVKLASALAAQLGGSLSLETNEGVRASLAFPWPRRR